MWWIKLLGEVVGIGKNTLTRRVERKKIEAESKIKIAIAKTEAEVNRIISNTTSDNAIDLESVKQLDRTWKDEFIITLFLMPVFSAAVVPFILAFKSGKWENLNQYMVESYKSLNQLPDWYPYVVGLILISTFGFRSMLRKGIEAFAVKWSSRTKIIQHNTGNNP